MIKWQAFLTSFIFVSLISSVGNTKPLKKPLDKPKLILVVVIDQLRADHLTRFQSRFLPSTSKKGVGGFNLLMSQGAYFPQAEYDIIQAMTCPGHAMIMTGAYPIDNGVILNDWYDKVARKEVYCAFDETHKLSPKNLRTTTISDELKNAGYKSQVIGIALKDRSAIMLAGHRADQVYWIEDKSLQWTTSTYYQEGKIPSWVEKQNQNLSKKIDTEYVWESKAKPTGLSDDSSMPFTRRFKIGAREALASPFGVQISLDLAMEAVKNLKLGKGTATDVLAISLSSHDLLGHAVGPNAREMEEMTVSEDQALAGFFSFLKGQDLLKDTLIVLTSDHGVAPVAEKMREVGINSGKLDYLALFKKLNSHFDKKYGKPKNNIWVSSYLALNFFFDRTTLAEKKIDLSDIEAEAKKVLLDEPGVAHIVTSSEFRNGRWPEGDLGQRLRRQYTLEQSGDFFIIPKPFYYSGGGAATTHVTGYSYDRTVPLILYGRGIQAGIYPEQARVIDIAPTLSFILGIIPPANNSGKILDVF